LENILDNNYESMAFGQYEVAPGEESVAYDGNYDNQNATAVPASPVLKPKGGARRNAPRARASAALDDADVDDTEASPTPPPASVSTKELPSKNKPAGRIRGAAATKVPSEVDEQEDTSVAEAAVASTAVADSGKRGKKGKIGSGKKAAAGAAVAAAAAAAAAAEAGENSEVDAGAQGNEDETSPARKSPTQKKQQQNTRTGRTRGGTGGAAPQEAAVTRGRNGATAELAARAAQETIEQGGRSRPS